MPALNEKVELVDFRSAEEMTVKRSYNADIDAMKLHSMNGAGMSILSTMLQYSLSYPDKPYGVSAILDSINGHVVVKPRSFSQYSQLERLLPKEKKLVDLMHETI